MGYSWNDPFSLEHIKTIGGNVNMTVLWSMVWNGALWDPEVGGTISLDWSWSCFIGYSAPDRFGCICPITSRGVQLGGVLCDVYQMDITQFNTEIYDLQRINGSVYIPPSCTMAAAASAAEIASLQQRIEHLKWVDNVAYLGFLHEDA